MKMHFDLLKGCLLLKTYLETITNFRKNYRGIDFRLYKVDFYLTQRMFCWYYVKTWFLCFIYSMKLDRIIPLPLRSLEILIRKMALRLSLILKLQNSPQKYVVCVWDFKIHPNFLCLINWNGMVITGNI